ncbi:ubiquitin-like protein ISG15 [Sorex fumeus]|uniref:ubiquitin-like protein ISG15 n=1 Tax=Sorex fumeus TaxID=62283 RepID=UPI0024AC9A82|nr:ubiquitin-like protein ISG15 [Sorex fumeus]
MNTVKVKKLNGEVYTVRLVDTLSELQQLVAQQQTDVPAFLQRLVLHPEGTVLRDGQSLASQGLRPDAIVLLVVEEDRTLSILVKNTRGQSVSYDVRLTQTVAELKQQVSVKERVPVDQFWLKFQEQSMEDRRQLGNYGLRNLSTVDMNLYLRGGAGGGVA